MGDREKIDYISIEIVNKLKELLILDKKLVSIVNKVFDEKKSLDVSRKKD